MALSSDEKKTYIKLYTGLDVSITDPDFDLLFLGACGIHSNPMERMSLIRKLRNQLFQLQKSDPRYIELRNRIKILQHKKLE